MRNGWFCHRSPFDFSTEYEPAVGIDRLRTGTPHVLSMVAFAEALGAYEGVSTEDLRTKSIGLTSLFIELIDSQIGCEVLTPRRPEDRGSQVSLLIPEAEKLMGALKVEDVLGDF